MKIVTEGQALQFVTTLIGLDDVGVCDGEPVSRRASPLVAAHLGAAIGVLPGWDDVWRRVHGSSLTPERARCAQDLIDYLDAVVTTLRARKPEQRKDCEAA